MRFLITSFLFFSSLSLFAEKLASPVAFDFEEFMGQVEKQNPELMISRKRIEQLEAAKAEPQLRFSPQAFLKSFYSSETSTGTDGIQSPGDKTQLSSTSFGVNKDWAPGLRTSLSHSFNRVDLEGIPAVTEPIWSHQLDLELRANLWRNLFGRENWSSLKAALATFDSQIAAEEFRIDRILTEAERMYWNAALAQEQRRSLEQTLERAKAILAWNRRRQKINVADQGDVLQSQARVVEIEQALLNAQMEERESRRWLSFFINGSFEATVVNPAWPLESLALKPEQVEIPQTWDPQSRKDLQAVESSQRAAEMGAASSRSALDPQLDAYFQYGGRSASSSFSEANSQTFDNSFPRFEVGVELSVPLFVPQLLRAKRAQTRAEEVARAQFSLEKYRLEKEFAKLVDSLSLLKGQVRLAEDLKRTQETKLSHEDQRFRQGRSSSFQVLSFQEDLAEAELNLLRLYAQLRGLIAEARLFGVPVVRNEDNPLKEEESP